jgi:hypothetical protein
MRMRRTKKMKKMTRTTVRCKRPSKH